MISKVIPNYAKNIKKEYIFIIDINKKCEKFLNKIDEENVFNSPQAKKLIIYFNKFLIKKLVILKILVIIVLKMKMLIL